MELLGGVKAEVVQEFVISLAVGEVIELHLCGVLAEEFNVYLVPRVVVGGSRICEE